MSTWKDGLPGGDIDELCRLSSQASGVLKRICSAHADRPFQEGREETLRPPEMTRVEFRLAFSELRRGGWVGAMRKIGGNLLFYIPAERLDMLQRCFFPVSPSNLEPEGIRLSVETGPGLSGELFRALLFVAEEGLPLTSKGAVHKKYVSRLAATMQLNDVHLQGLDLRSPYPDDYPLTAVLAIDLLLHMGLLVRRNQVFMPEAQAVQNWLNLNEREMSVLLHGAASRRYGSQTAAERQFRCLILRPEYFPGCWYSLADTIDWMEAQGLAEPGERPGLEGAAAAWLRCLAGFGWVEVGSAPGHSLCFRWTSAKPLLPEPSETVEPVGTRIITQPDLEVLVPEETPFSLRWSLACFAELIQIDCMWSFRLTRERLEWASARGISPEEVIEWLEQYAEAGLPGQVRAVLGQWGRDIGRTVLAETLVLSCRSEQDADAIAGHPRLLDSLERLGPLHFGVSRDRADWVRRELASAGMLPLEGRPGHNGEGPQEASLFRLYIPGSEDNGSGFTLTTDSAAGLWYAEDHGAAMQAEMPSAPESAEELWPDAAEVPSVWIKEGRRYHASTARLLMEQALKWGTKVRLSREGRTCEFIPDRILPGVWRVSGHLIDCSGDAPQERELSDGDWDTIQLIVPVFRGFSSSSTDSGCGMIG
ncbi:helicase-associated domain-containing protein [Paenibacillus rhizophilus]|uniref:Helicase XPB/Ssl2 N-terminal domain-containing protein n=1 Tax=Paenibacillus rhizophilus TaxID=1850366 RepID=A0A3N9NWN8_9BACL|nr:helicase-associated domain-containing protein [Paenibacillus rhizophilus]RQW07727.1 hypothetical protein EH198_24260 [Paenibacillus rhizophilus]